MADSDCGVLGPKDGEMVYIEGYPYLNEGRKTLVQVRLLKREQSSGKASESGHGEQKAPN